MFYRLLFLCCFCYYFVGSINGKVIITEPVVKPVYLKEGDELVLLCQQFSGFKIFWSRKTFNTGDYEPVDNSVDSGFIELASLNGIYNLWLKKTNVQVSDSGSYKCSVRTGRDLPYAVDVFVMQIRNTSGPIVQAGNHTDLSCSLLDSTFKPSVIWFKDGIELARSNSPFHSNLSPPASSFSFSYTKFISNTTYAEDSTDSTLTINNIGDKDVGEYICQFYVNDKHSFNQSVYLYSHPQIKGMGRSENTVEGRRMEVECKAWGWPPPVVIWTRSKELLGPQTPLEKEGRVGFKNGTLILEEAHVKDRAYYTCVASTHFNSSLHLSTSATVLVRVRGKFAPLVPLVGLLVEFVVLCVIIYLYERKRKCMKAEKEAMEAKEMLAQEKDVNSGSRRSSRSRRK